MNQVEKGRVNKESLVNYIAQIERAKKGFPINQFGKINLNEVAKNCGFLRGVFATNKKMASLLEDAVKRIGLEDSAKKASSNEFLSNKVVDVEKQMGKLRKSNAVKSEEISALRQQVIELELEIIKLKNKCSEDSEAFEEMIATGRRFTL